MADLRMETASEYDLVACYEIAKSLSEYFNDSGLAAMSRDLKTEETLVIRDGSDCLGFACAKIVRTGVAEILWMGVRKDRIRQGLGSLLMDALCQRLQETGTRFVTVKTLAPTVDYYPYEKTRLFYQKMGFVLIEVIDPYPVWGQGNPCAIYVKAL